MIAFFYFLLDFGDLNKSFSIGNAHASQALRSWTITRGWHLAKLKINIFWYAGFFEI